jgi:hypothetical protein
MRCLPLVLALVLACAPAADAQVARIRGTVKTESGEPVKGAIVTVRSAVVQPNEFRSSTDEKGEWSILGLRSGVWSLEVVADGFETARNDVRVSSFDRNRSFDVILAPARVGVVPGRFDAVSLQSALKEADDHAEAKRWAEAIEAYRAILQAAPALTTVSLPLGRACREAGRFDEAVAAFKSFLAIHARSQIALVELGRTYLAAGDNAGAVTALTEAVDVAPSTAHAASARALLEQAKR